MARRVLITVVAALHLVLADAVTKELAIGYLKGERPVDLIPGFFGLAYVENRGASWGMFQGHVWPLAVFGVAALAFLISKRRDLFLTGDGTWRGRVGAFAETFLYAGIVGNLIDRFCRGCVIDFVHCHWRDAWHFPCFNLADIFITAAAAMLVVLAFAVPKNAAKKENDA